MDRDKEATQLVVYWDSIEFSGELPIVHCYTLMGKHIELKFAALEELQELVNTLKGACNAMQREIGGE